MHAISYQMKRCHLSAVAVGRRILRGTKPPDHPQFDGVPDMTPARFDILYLVLGRRTPRIAAPRMMAMAEIRRTLGLARSTISEAVKRLVELGLVTCDYVSGNDRNKVVFLTEKGEARIKSALHLVFTGRALTRHYQRFVETNGRKKRNRPWRLAERLSNIRDHLQDLARHHFDRSDALYAIRGGPE